MTKTTRTAFPFRLYRVGRRPAAERQSPITAAALLGSFFSLLRRMNISRHYTRVFPGYRIKCGMTRPVTSTPKKRVLLILHIE